MGICALPMRSTDVYTYPYMHMPDLVRRCTAAKNMMLDFVISTFVCFMHTTGESARSTFNK